MLPLNPIFTLDEDTKIRHGRKLEEKEMTCPDGYQLVSSLGTCRLIKRLESISPGTRTTCSNGIGNLYEQYTGGPLACRNGGTLQQIKTCPTGYVLKSIYVEALNKTSYLCKDPRLETIDASGSCSPGYYYFTDTLCYTPYDVEATITYSCPTGYTLNEDKCYEE